MNSKPTLSVVLTNYNHGHYLPKALYAILSQSRKPEEVIIIDDASTDDSRAIIAACAEDHACVRAMYNEKNSGVVANANRGLDMAIGTYVFFASADDFILPGFAEKLMAAAEQYPGVGLVTSEQAFLYENEEVITVSPLPLGNSERCLTGDAVLRALRALPFSIGGHVSIVKREAAIDAGGLLPELRWHCDWFMNQVVAFRHGIAFVPEALSVMRVAATSYSGGNIRSWQSQRPVLVALADHLRSSRYADVREAFAQSGILISFDPFFTRLALRNWNAFSLLRPILVGRALLSWAERMRLQKIIPAPILSRRRARKKAHILDVMSSLDFRA
jgi:glycosyltransferase involved in cell wall biosynthesis